MADINFDTNENNCEIFTFADANVIKNLSIRERAAGSGLPAAFR